MSIGEFAKRSQLSAKALRQYDELGLLVPARVDESSGYRFYDADQLGRARLIAALRRLQLPLAEIKLMVELDDPAAVAQRIGERWAQAEIEHADRRRLAGYLVDRLSGKRSVMYDVITREIPQRRLLCLKANVMGESGAWALGKQFIGLLQQHELPRVEGAAGAVFCIYWGEVSDDSDGPLEWCRPVPADEAAALAIGLPELILRDEPAHREALIEIGPSGRLSPAQWQLTSESMHAWAQEHHAQPSDLGTRITYRVSGPRGPDSEPDCEFVVPLGQ